MSPRAIALAGVLQHQLTRVGRPAAAVTLGADERTVTLADTDGRWQGPVPIAIGALVVWADGEGSSELFWQQFAPAPAPSA